MVFNSLNYLFLFLPIFIIIYLLADRHYKNYVALIASLIFFSWGQLYYLPLMIFIIIFNYFLGKQIEKKRGEATKTSQILLIGGIITNCVLLIFFKAYVVYGAKWIFLSSLLTDQLKQNPLPLGLSYISFQVISYIIDVFNERCDSEKSLINFSLYIMLFPKILVGPITPYRNLTGAINSREVKPGEVANGIRRFITGLAKKVLIADTIAFAINPAFSFKTANFSTAIAWFVLIAYSVQLYFDFSGVTDMAIGIGQILGFRFVENFNYPYISKNITEFWRRWHISLASWFRDYVFYPLEFHRRNSTFFRQQINIFIVFLLTGLWHGLTLNFLVWGGLHGIALALEMTFMKYIKRLWTPIQHFYTLTIILSGWVFFRSSSLEYALNFFARLFGSTEGLTPIPFSISTPLPIINNSVWVALISGIIFSLPIVPAVQKRWGQIVEQNSDLQLIGQIGSDLILLALSVLSVAAITNSGIFASIYGGF
jgi:alginate O-acetyltransferase complex protein AlgI